MKEKGKRKEKKNAQRREVTKPNLKPVVSLFVLCGQLKGMITNTKQQ